MRIPSGKHVSTGIHLVHLTLVRLRLFNVLGGIDQYHVVLATVWRGLLLSVDCIIFSVDEWIMILSRILGEELLISSWDVCMTLR